MYDMTIELHTDSGKCLYEQIYEHIKKEIRDGKLLAGERLPSTRSLAEYLQVARSTVDYAYGQLLDEGYIEARPYRGYFVCSVEGLVQLEKRREAAAGKRNLENRVQGQRGDEKREIDFSPFSIDMSGFPFSVWRKISGRILSDANSDLFSRGAAQGDFELRETISRYLHASRGVKCEPEQVIVGAGNDYLLMLLEKILGRHVPVAMENPTYIRSYKLFQSFAYPVTGVEMDENGICVEALRRTEAELAYVMPSHQFPMGTVMPIGRRLELLKWAEESGERYLIEDDYDSEFRFHGKPIPALQSIDEQGKVIYLGTFSKAIAPAIRISFLVLPNSLLEIYRKNCSFYSCTVSRIDQSILNEFIRDGYFERHLNKMRKVYRAKHDFLLENIRPLQGDFIISGENAGLHLLLTDKKRRNEKELLSRAAQAGVRVYSMREFLFSGEPDRAAFLLGFGGLDTEKIEEGIYRLCEAWK